MNYMKPYWESRLAECDRGREYAEKQLGQIALSDMAQLTLLNGEEDGRNTNTPDAGGSPTGT